MTANSKNLSVLPIADAGDLRRFAEVAAMMRPGDPAVTMQQLTDPTWHLGADRDPRFSSARRVLFLAERDGLAVGRIAATVGRGGAWDLGDRTATFGHFDVVDDFVVSEALIEAAGDWARAHGAVGLRGPFNGSPIDETGMLISGFDRRPPVGLGRHPPYYVQHIERLGFAKHEDFYAYEGTYDDVGRDLQALSDALWRAAARVRGRRDVALRELDPSAWDRDIRAVYEVYVASHATIPGHPGMSFAGFEAEARALLPFIDPDLAMLIEVEGRPVAMGLALPDLNEALSGVTSPRSLIGRIRVGWRLRNLQTVSFKLIGVDPEFRRMGLESLLITEILRRGVEKGFERCDLSLVRELNQAMRRLIERLGARRYLSYRTFERPIRP